MSKTTHTRLGSVEAFTDLPALVNDGSRTFFLVRDASGFRLLSTVCPHQGGPVYDQGSRFECPLHGWRFDRVTGRSINAPSRELTAIPVAVEAGVLYADLPAEPRVDQMRHGGRPSKPGLTVRLHAHACLEMSYEGFTLLTDPWLDGPAFLGSWAPYPPHEVSGADLKPDAIVITHEHSDHFHEPTLRRFDRRTPIYVPDFPNERMPRRLRAMGFSDVRPMPFAERCTPHDGWRLTTFEPASYWNDAFVLIEIEEFRILDINDAGVNARIASLVGPVDVIAVQFSGGASGYPWTWAHLSDEEKIAISAKACAGKLRIIREATTLYGASTVLPFASHFTLWHPSQRAYGRQMRRNSLEDVTTVLEGIDADVIDLLPGETWDVGKGLIRRTWDDRDTLYEPERVERYRNTAVDAAAFAEHHPTDESLSEPELIEYLTRLNAVPDIAVCEDLTVRMHAIASAGGAGLDVSFAIEAGRLKILPAPPDTANLTIDIPLGVLGAIVRDGLSWDEAFIGYWCRFSRHPNVYHAGFWRLLQAPYFMRPIDAARSPADAIGKTSTVAEVLEAHGAAADRILRRYGLYCFGCDRSTAESIEMAARQHGIDHRRVDRLVAELNQAFGGLDQRPLAVD